MIYDSTKPFDWDALLVRFHVLYERGKTKRTLIEITDKTNRTLSQNAYLHVIIGYLALQLGETEDYVKRYYFKYSANRDIFFRGWKDIPFTDAKEMDLRSTKDLSVEEMSLAIDRFLDWSAEQGYPLPEAMKKDAVQQCMVEVENYKQFL